MIVQRKTHYINYMIIWVYKNSARATAGKEAGSAEPCVARPGAPFDSEVGIR